MRYFMVVIFIFSIQLRARAGESGPLDQVEIYLNAKIQKNSRRPEINEANAEALRFFRQGECALAVDAATLSLKESKKKDPLPLIVRGTCHFNNQRPDLAVADYERAATISKEAKAALKDAIAVAYLELGQQLTESNQAEQARRAFGRSLRWRPAYAGAHTELAYLSLLEKKYPACVASADRALQIDPKSFRALVNRGACLSSMGKWEKAVGDLSKALELDPKNAVAYLNRATSYLFLKDCVRAVTDANEAVSIDDKMREPASQILSQCGGAPKKESVPAK